MDEKETASKKIINIWENIDNKDLSKSNNWLLFKLSLKIMKFKRTLHRFIKKDTDRNKNFKFPPFEKDEILLKIDKLRKILKIKNELSCEFLSDRTLLIKRK